MFRTAALALLGLALSACGEPEQPDPEAAAQMGEAKEIPRALPHADAPARYVGRWATAQENCDRYDWYFQPQRISTPGEVSCAFDTVEETDSGYRILAVCTAEGPPESHEIQIAFAESAQAMLLTGGPWSGTERGLVYCGPVEPDSTGAPTIGTERD